MNKLTITQKGLIFIKGLEVEYKGEERVNQESMRTTTLPSLKKQKILKLNKSKNQKFQAIHQNIKEKYRCSQEAKSTAYDKETDKFWNKWDEGFDVAQNWNKQNNQGQQRYHQRIKQKKEEVYGKFWKKFCKQ